MSPIARLCYTAIKLILSQVVHLPGGYAWWHSLPLKGKKAAPALIRKWARVLSEHCYPIQLRQAILVASLNEDGIPDQRSMQLYLWTLRNLYRGNAVSMHREWQQLITVQQAAEQRRLLHSVPKKMPTVKPMPTKGMGTWHEYPPAHNVHITARLAQQEAAFNTPPLISAT